MGLKDAADAILSGCNDVLVSRSPDGTLRSTSFCVRFGRIKLRSRGKVVRLECNGLLTDVYMIVGEGGECRFIDKKDVPSFEDDPDSPQAQHVKLKASTSTPDLHLNTSTVGKLGEEPRPPSPAADADVSTPTTQPPATDDSDKGSPSAAPADEPSEQRSVFDVAQTVRALGHNRESVPSHDTLVKLNLKPGRNDVRFSVVTRVRGIQELKCRVYLIPTDTKIVISDVDGTITKSNVGGQVAGFFKKDYTHNGIARFYSQLADEGYQIIYLTSRPITSNRSTREYIDSVVQSYQVTERGHIEVESCKSKAISEAKLEKKAVKARKDQEKKERKLQKSFSGRHQDPSRSDSLLRPLGSSQGLALSTSQHLGLSTSGRDSMDGSPLDRGRTGSFAPSDVDSQCSHPRTASLISPTAGLPPAAHLQAHTPTAAPQDDGDFNFVLSTTTPALQSSANTPDLSTLSNKGLPPSTNAAGSTSTATPDSGEKRPQGKPILTSPIKSSPSSLLRWGKKSSPRAQDDRGRFDSVISAQSSGVPASPLTAQGGAASEGHCASPNTSAAGQSFGKSVNQTSRPQTPVSPSVLSPSQSQSSKGWGSLFKRNKKKEPDDDTPKKMKEFRLPPGPIIACPDFVFQVLFREVVKKQPHLFKIPALLEVLGIFGYQPNPPRLSRTPEGQMLRAQLKAMGLEAAKRNKQGQFRDVPRGEENAAAHPFVVAFGNAPTDKLSYYCVGISLDRIYIVNPKSEIRSGNKCDTLKELAPGEYDACERELVVSNWEDTMRCGSAHDMLFPKYDRRPSEAPSIALPDDDDDADAVPRLNTSITAATLPQERPSSPLITSPADEQVPITPVVSSPQHDVDACPATSLYSVKV